MATLSIEQVAALLPELIAKLAPGEEIIIVDGDSPVAKVTSTTRGDLPILRRLALTDVDVAIDADEQANDFARYMT